MLLFFRFNKKNFFLKMKYLLLLSLICLAFSKKSFMSHFSHKADACFNLYNPSIGKYLNPNSGRILNKLSIMAISSDSYQWCQKSDGRLYNGIGCLAIYRSSDNPLTFYPKCIGYPQINQVWKNFKMKDSDLFWIQSGWDNSCVTAVDGIAYPKPCKYGDKSQLWQKA